MVQLLIRGPRIVLRLSKLTDYAVVVLVRLATSPAVQTSPGIAAATAQAAAASIVSFTTLSTRTGVSK